MTNPFFKYRDARPSPGTNLTVLTSNFMPESFPHRQGQIDQMVNALSSVMGNTRPSNLLLYGKSGTGKTSIAKSVSNLLEEAFGSDVTVIYINCQLNDSPYSVLVAMANAIITEKDEKVPVTGWTMERIYTELLRKLDETHSFVVLILDEIDKIITKSGADSLYVILKLSDDSMKCMVSFIGITNYTSFLETLDARVRSRLNQESIVFPSYNASQLRDILNERIQLAGVSSIVQDSALSLCAAIGAREHGDARKAIDLMRISIEIGLRNSSATIGEDHVYAARDKYEMNVLRESIIALPLHSKLVLLSAVVTQDQERDQMITGEIFDTYRKICLELNIQPLTTRRLSDLLSDLDDIGLIITMTKSLGRYGRTRLIHVPDSEGNMKRYLLEDEILGTFKGVKVGKQHRLGTEDYEPESRVLNREELIDRMVDSRPEDDQEQY